LKITAAFVCAAFLISPEAAWSQDAPIKIDLAPLLSTLNKKSWYDVSHSNTLADAVQAALSHAPFQSAPGPGADVLTLAMPDGVGKQKDEYVFTVVFLRDGAKLGEAVESCPVKKLSDCTDQLILDTKTAASN
jgi:hypothetical protein